MPGSFEVDQRGGAEGRSQISTTNNQIEFFSILLCFPHDPREVVSEQKSCSITRIEEKEREREREREREDLWSRWHSGM